MPLDNVELISLEALTFQAAMLLLVSHIAMVFGGPNQVLACT